MNELDTYLESIWKLPQLAKASPKCRAKCQNINRYRFDAAFELAEERLLWGTAREELEEDEVNQMISKVCRDRTFAQVKPIRWRGFER